MTRPLIIVLSILVILLFMCPYEPVCLTSNTCYSKNYTQLFFLLFFCRCLSGRHHPSVRFWYPENHSLEDDRNEVFQIKVQSSTTPDLRKGRILHITLPFSLISAIYTHESAVILPVVAKR